VTLATTSLAILQLELEMINASTAVLDSRLIRLFMIVFPVRLASIVWVASMSASPVMPPRARCRVWKASRLVSTAVQARRLSEERQIPVRIVRRGRQALEGVKSALPVMARGNIVMLSVGLFVKLLEPERSQMRIILKRLIAQSTHSVWAPPILALLALMVATVRLEAQAAQRQHLDITMMG